jgi:hypothetical protein
MRLSEAILLGSAVVHPRAGGLRFAGTNEGCALGMAAIAAGGTFCKPLRQIPVKDLRTVNIESIFGPWLLRVVMRPCECPREFPREMRTKDVIAHLFDVHVMEKKNWSLEQLVEWVQRWEPREYTPETKVEIDEERRSRLSPSRTAELGVEEVEWQSTRKAFDAKHKSKRTRRLGAN